MILAREEEDGLVNANLPAILFIDEQASKVSDFHTVEAGLDKEIDDSQQQ